MKKIFVYAYYSDQILDPSGVLKAKIGGAEVQLALWAKALASESMVYSFSYSFRRCIKKKNDWGIHFCYVPFIHKVNALLFYLRPLWFFLHRPDYVMMKAASQEIGIILILKKIIGFKIIYLLASDNDVEADNTIQKKRIVSAIRNADYVIAQNEYQKKKVKERLGIKDVMQLGNIWDKSIFTDRSNQKEYDYVWVSKFNGNKRPEWFVEMAKASPQKTFAMVGPSMRGYENLIEEMKTLKNLTYFGFKSLFETTEIISKSRCVVCTSGYEGFPNTFLQAFSYNIPVLSTVDPSDIIKKYSVGFVYNSLEEALDIIKEERLLQIDKQAIYDYFKTYHDPASLINRMEDFIRQK